jgi:transcriptional regulator with XRE-family HTH domain
MQEITYSLGYWIERRRKALDLTRAGLADLVSCSPETIKKIERDERRPSPQIAGLLAEALSLSDLERETFLQVAQKQRPVDSLVLAGEPLQPLPVSPSASLLAQATPFIGRESELSQIAAWLANPYCRLVTLVGPGGIGKSRLALKTAEEQRDNYQQGVYFVALAGTQRSDGLAEVIAASLGLPRKSSEDPQDRVLRYLHNKEVLLVLDNYEQLLPETKLLISLLQNTSRVKLLVTSRERLNLQSEWVYSLDGLEVPALEDSSELERYSSVALFVQTAGRQRVGFKMDESNRRAVAHICRQVGGCRWQSSWPRPGPRF